jgi:hypothetical protein
VRGLRYKICEFYNNICTLEYDIISVTETWLSNDITDDELFCNSYTVYRSDRNFSSLGVKKGGGVLIAVNNKFSSNRLNPAALSFYAKLHEIFNLHVPKRRLINQSRKYPPWFDREIIKTIQMKHRLFRKYKRSMDLGHYNEFKGYRSKCKLLISTSYKKYMLSIECKLSKDPKRF